MSNQLIKDPSAILDYGVDWTNELDGSPITASSWSLNGLTEVSSSNDDSVTKVIVSGGEIGKTYLVTNTINYTKDGAALIDERSFKISIKNK